MLLCRRLCAAAVLDPVFRPPGSFGAAVPAKSLRSRSVAHRPAGTWEPWPGWGGRVATIAANLSRSGHGGGGGAVLDTGSSSMSDPGGRAVFAGHSGLCTAVNTGASSAAAAAQKKGDAGEDTNKDTDKDTDKGNLKEASTTEKAPGEAEPEEEKPNKTQQLKKVFKEYGAVGVSFHIGISLMSLGMFYLLISSGIDMASILCKLGFNEVIVRSKMAAGTSTFVLAYAIHKLFAPVRISITLVSVPLIVRYFRKTGLFKPPTAAP
ncbi:protein FAM210B, mitochondrial [Echeneis naucrates]|nr:protein FAM210B, mitochondrial [Echeneis naucrates]